MKLYKVTVSVPPSIRAIPFYKRAIRWNSMALPGAVMARETNPYDSVVTIALTGEVIEECDGIYTHQLEGGGRLFITAFSPFQCGIAGGCSYIYIPAMSTVHILNSIMWREQNPDTTSKAKVARSVDVKLGEKSFYTYIGLHAELRERKLFEPRITFLADVGKALREVEDNRKRAAEACEKLGIWFYPNTIARLIASKDSLSYITKSNLVLSTEEVN